ncbi:hypothetical protein Ntsu_23230 [Nocardia sp. IFM 10818]
MAVTACCPVRVRPGSQETTQRSPPTQRAMCEVMSLVIMDAETTSIATDCSPHARDKLVIDAIVGRDAECQIVIAANSVQQSD